MKLTTTLLATSAITLAGTAAFADAHMADTMTIVSWGGAYSASQQGAYHDPYAANTGITIVNDESSGEAVAKLRAMSEAGNITWDLVDVEAADAIRLCDEGLAIEIDHDEMLAPAADGTSASEDFGDSIISDCFIPQIVFSTTVGYRTDMVGETPPTDICAIFDTTTYPGKRALAKKPLANVEWALLCDGVAKDDIYEVLATPEGQDQAFAKLDTIKDDVIWWSAGAETPQLLADGEVTMTITWNGRIFNAIAQEGQPFGLVWDGQIYDLDLWAIPKGAPNKEAALDFVGFSTATEQLAAQASYIPYGPARKSSIPLIGTYYTDDSIQMIDHMPTTEKALKDALQNDYEFWADNQDELNERFNSWLAN